MALLFGYGLIRTNGDFGTQAPAPDHPELLDWLATEFRKQGMSLKKLHRLIVTSSTYRQDSKASPSLLEKDPQNRLLARGPRFRLSGELIRDHMLKASGKLSGKMFGPGVYPPQPLLCWLTPSAIRVGTLPREKTGIAARFIPLSNAPHPLPDS